MLLLYPVDDPSMKLFLHQALEEREECLKLLYSLSFFLMCIYVSFSPCPHPLCLEKRFYRFWKITAPVSVNVECNMEYEAEWRVWSVAEQAGSEAH